MARSTRRRFLASAALAAGATSGAACIAQPISATPATGNSRHYFEWRTYRVKKPAQQSRLLDYLQSAATPAWKRLGMGPVGVFTEVGPKASLDVHLLLPFDSPQSFLNERTALEADAAYLQAAEQHLAAKKNDPAFGRIQSTLMVAFAGQPQLAAPAYGQSAAEEPAQDGPCVLELRTYQSHSEERARRKIEMFNNGEIPIFRKAGFETVFFGESLYGAGLPNLKYLLASPSMSANKESWKRFVDHPEWKAMKDLPEYANTVSKIQKVFLTPTDFSAI